VFAVPTGIIGWGFQSVGQKYQARRKALKAKRAKGEDEEEDDDDPEKFDLHLSSDGIF
jgi:hypothetical protein